MSLTPSDVLQAEGLISRRLERYESRPEQIEMADAVLSAIQNSEHLIVEAGTGVGKSFAYLVPAILAATEKASEEGKSQKVVISTHTISLQEQLIQRDIPFLNAVLPVEFSAVLVKGRGNYLSLRRLALANEKGRSLFDTEESRQLTALREWAAQSYDGTLADLDFKPVPQVWDEVRSEHGNCMGRKCATYNDCFYYRARRRVWNADILVVNHALFFSDLALRREGASVLPDYDVAIFDEAHTLEDVAAAHLGMSVTSGQFSFLFNKLCNDRTQRGLLYQHNLVPAQQLVSRLRFLTDDLFQQVSEWKEEGSSKNGRVREQLDIANPVSTELHELSRMIRNYAEKLDSEERALELKSSCDRLDLLGYSLNDWLKQREEDAVYWVEETGGRRRNVQLMSSPIDVGPRLRDELFGQVNSVILTSATLSVGKQDFSFFKKRIGLTKANELKLGSPFDFEKQVRLVLPTSMPNPSEEPSAYNAAVCSRIRQHVAETNGGTFVLFTSYRMLRECAEQLTAWCAEQNRLLLCQGTGLDRTRLLSRFREDGQAILFGTETFWQGVDVPGNALSSVIITKLPFSVPDHPLLEARIERIRQNGGNPFVEYQIPEAAIKLRQGFGRLIRTKDDVGEVILLDPRIQTKAYGKKFLESLPKCRTEVVPASEK
ncbi:MAG: DEAD/DEAH box helicase [Planctomycetaceae bacterium]|nr:DEAD/DEAH box helicase [Planctomycetaceae bacterium]MCA9045411.1 DEAD/DEAH box helicase [Planctomycetaceae bacterium]